MVASSKLHHADDDREYVAIREHVGAYFEILSCFYA